MTDTELIPLDRFIEDHGITIETIRVDEKPGFVPYVEPFQRRPSGMMPTPSADEDGWRHFAWSVTLNRGTPGVDHQGIATPFRSGIAHVKRTRKLQYFSQWAESLPLYQPTPPTAADVLDSLASDASAWENARNFEDFANDLGYDTDSRKAEKIYNACGEVAKSLRHFLGNAAYQALLYEVERL
ncbi:MAG TPA: hypothetical protein VFX15_03240 [Actinomycetes bacterium]|nr:hypothetical protein [Actinomycetes bacterium]